MDINFDQSIFGQLIQPKQVNIEPKQEQYSHETLSIKILNNGHFHQQPSPQPHPPATGHKNIHSTYSIFEGSASKSNQQSCYGKALSTRSTEIGENARQPSLNRLKIKKISSEDLLPCIKCQDQGENKDCPLCDGTGFMKGNDSLARFFQYLIEFKLGLQQSYKPKDRQKNVVQCCNKTPRVICRSSLPNKNYTNFSQFKEKNVESALHAGYECDGCQAYPIVGVRYHCSEPQCQDDYDLCEHCYFKLDHEHNMQEIRQSEIHKKLQIFSSSLVRPSKSEKLDTQKIFSSSIY